MGRMPKAATRIATAGAVTLLVGAGLVATVAVQALSAPAYADTSPFEVVCGGTPLGEVVLNGAVVSGTLSPADPAPGQQFDLDGAQIQVPLPASVLDAVPVGEGSTTTWSGSLEATVDATGATPATLSTGALGFSDQVPDPPPSDGVEMDAPSAPVDLGPFTATASSVSLSVGTTADLSLDVAGISLTLSCSTYPNDSDPVSGITQGPPPGLPVAPVIAVSGGTAPPPPAPALTGAYELYCPHTPVGDLVFNGVTTSASLSGSSGLAAGGTFSVTNYQTHIPVPAGLVSAAAGLSNSSFDGLATGAVDVYGAGPAQVSTGSMAFDVPFPDPVPSSGLGLELPLSPLSLGPFTADGGAITVAQDPTLMVVAALSSKAFTMTCTAYPDDDEAASGSTGTPPPGQPIEPIIALGTASGGAGSTTTTTTTPGGLGGLPPSTGPYELYCPGSPVGNIVLNDTTTTATLSPAAPVQGGTFTLADLQMQFSLPQSVVQEAEGLGLTQLTGDVSLFLDATGVNEENYGYGVAVGTTSTATSTSTSVGVTTGGGVSEPPFFPEPFPGSYDMPLDVTLPDPVPAAGVQFTLTPGPGDDEQFVAAGGPIQVTIGGVDINATEFGDSFGMFCDPYPNDTDPTGLASLAPDVEPANPLVAQGTATIPPPAPSGPGPYELFCPNTPVGDIAINDVTSSATLSPAHPAPGQQFTVTGYQSQVTLPSDITDAAAALGNDAISGSATTTFAAEGATPASVPSGTMDFDATIPDPLPAQGLTLNVPAAPLDIGTFTATASPVTITQSDQVSLTLMGTGTDTAPLAQATCTAYPDDTEPSGIVPFGPDQPPIEPVLATTAPAPPPPEGQSGPYELYCPGTPVGDVVLNDAVSSASLSPADPTPGQQFSVTGYQVSLALPAEIVTAAAALGNVAIQGTASALLDAAGATPPSISTGTLDFDVPIPDPVPAGGLAMTIPVPAATVGPFTATASPVTISQDTNVSMSLNVSGSTLTLSCRSYPNDSESTGIVTASPPGSPEAPVVVTAAGSTTTPPTTTAVASTTPTTTTLPPTTTVPPTTTAPTTTTIPVGAGDTTTTTAPSVQGTEATTTTAAPGTTHDPSTPSSVPSSSDPVTKSASSDPAVTPATVVTAPSSSLAFTGVGSELRWLLVVGTALVVLGLALLLLVDAPRRLLVRLHRGAPVAGGAGPGGGGRRRMWQPRP